MVSVVDVLVIIQYSCKKWVHRKCSGTKGSMYKVMKSFICRGCVNPVTGTGCTSTDIGGDDCSSTTAILIVSYCLQYIDF